MKKNLGLVFLITLLLLSCFKPTDNEKRGNIKGIVRDAISMLPIANVSVSITNGSTVTTNSVGEYNLEGLTPKNYELHFVKTGYLDNTTSVNVTSGSTVQKDIQLIPVIPELVSNTTFVNFGTQLTTSNIVLSNNGSGTINWSIASTEDWLHFNPVSGTLDDGTSPITLTVDRTGMNPGNYSTNVVITSNANSVTIGVLMTMPNANVPLLSVSPTFLDFGLSSTSRVLAFENNGVGTSTWSITSNQSWIGFSPSNGSTYTETDEVTITVNRSGLQSGDYSGSIDIVSNSGNSSIPITMEVTQLPVIEINTYTLDFEQTITSLLIVITNVGNGSLNWTASDNADWMTLQPYSGTGNGSISVNVDRTGMAGGDYTGNILLTSNGGNRTVAVNMTVPSNLPDGVTILSAIMANQTTAQINWTRFIGSGFSAYKVYRGTTSGVNNTNGALVFETSTANVTTCNDLSFQPQTQYYYCVYVRTTQNQMIPSTNILGLTTPPVVGQWSVNQTISNLYAVDFFNLNFGMAVGYNKTYSYSGDAWLQENTNSGDDIEVISPTCIYTNHMYYNGITWTPLSFTGLCVSGTDSNHIWMGVYGSYEDFVYYFNGTSWAENSPGNYTIKAIDALQSDIVYAVDVMGKVFKYNNLGWNQIYDFDGNAVYTIRVISNGEFWITSRNYGVVANNIYRFYNDSLIEQWDTEQDVNCVDALSTNDVWFGGNTGSIWHYDGNNLLSVASPCTFNIYDIDMIDTHNGWAVGDGCILKYVKSKK